ncbi:MAG: glycosyltransferase [Flavobacteriales bacterium]|nr:glycosyltransferase [Flavobacteriales bacterium]
MKKTTVSIIIPCFNHGAYLQEAIDSTQWSHHDHIEVIVVNDGSDDAETLKVLETISSERVSVLHQENAGLAAARNAGISAAKGEYLLFLDADNKIDPKYFLQAQKIFEENADVSVVYSDSLHFGEDDEKLMQLTGLPFPRLAISNFIDACAVVRKTAFDEYGGFDEKMPVMGYEDWELWMRFWKQGVGFYHIDEPLFQYRVSASSMLSNTNKIENRKSNIEYIFEKHLNVYEAHSIEIFKEFFNLYLHSEEAIQNQRNQVIVDLRKALDLKNDHISNIEKQLQIYELQPSPEELQTRIDQLTNQNVVAIESITQLQFRIAQMENSRTARLIRNLKAFKNKFHSNYSKEAGGGFLKKMTFALSKKGITLVRAFVSKLLKHLYLLIEVRKVIIIDEEERGQEQRHSSYHNWLMSHLPNEDQLIQYNRLVDTYSKKPKFSIIIPVYNPNLDHFEAAIKSVLHQNYQNWELCLADDCSSDPEVKKFIDAYLAKDSRIKCVYRSENGHISAASNSGLEIATGDYIVLMDQDDLLTKDALFQNLKVINSHETVHLIYSDEDKVNDFGEHGEAHFKPDWSPDNLLSRNYLGHLTVFEVGIFRRIGGWREGFEGSQDYDLVLRFTEQTDAVYHIPRILYHWRIHAASAASSEDAKPYAYIAAQRALTEALERRKEPGQIDFLQGFRGYSVRYNLNNPTAKVSIIIPTKDKTDLLKVCIESIVEKSTHKNYEIVVVDNNSEEKVFFQYMDSCKKRLGDRFNCVRAEIPFNFSKLINIGAQECTGDYLVLLNNDTEVISPDWMEGMMEQSQRPSIGVVGVKLLYPDNTIQHAGVIMGLGGAAGHVLVGEDRNGPGYFNYVNMTNNYSAVTAACVMIKKDLFDSVNGFDEKFSVEYNDIDFCLRIRETGRNNIYLPHTELYHHESISRGHPHASKASYELHLKEIQYLKDRWMNYIDHDPCYNPNLSLGAHDFRMKM